MCIKISFSRRGNVDADNLVFTSFNSLQLHPKFLSLKAMPLRGESVITNLAGVIL
jgi:hypothetical protein